MTRYLEQDSWYVSQQYGRQGSTGYFVLRDEPFAQAPHQTAMTLGVKPMSTITLTDTVLGTKLFSGIVTNPQMVFLSPTLIEYRLNCRDYTLYADSRLVTASYDNVSSKAVLTDICAHSNTGITADPNMPDGPSVTALQFDHVTISDAADQLSQLASWQSDYAFYIDYDLVMRWGNEASLLAAQISSGAPTLVVSDVVTGAPTASRAYIDLGGQWAYDWDGSTIRDACTVRGASKAHTQTDSFLGDGTTTQWPLAFDLDQGGSVTITVAGTNRTIEVTSDPTHPKKQWSLYQAPSGVWSIIKGTASTPLAGEQIVVAYTAQIPVTAQYTNTTSTVQYDGPNGGVFEIFLAENTIKDSATAYARARAEVQQFGDAQERFQFTIVENWPGHIHTGQVFQVESSWLPDARNLYQVGFTDFYIANTVHIEGREAGRRRYQVQAVRFAKVA